MISLVAKQCAPESIFHLLDDIPISLIIIDPIKALSINTRPRISHFNYGIQIIQYLFNTQNYCLTYSFLDSKKANFEIEAFTDSDFANSNVDRKSYSGYIIFVNNWPISWSSTKQNLVALSSNEAEIIAANEILRTVLFIKKYDN